MPLLFQSRKLDEVDSALSTEDIPNLFGFVIVFDVYMGSLM